MDPKLKASMAKSIAKLLMVSPVTQEDLGIWSVGNDKDGALCIGLGDPKGHEFWILRAEMTEASEFEVKALKSMSATANGVVETDAPIHEWFGLSYANYLVIPRSILQSCSLSVQRQMVAGLDGVYREWTRNGGDEWPHGAEIEVKIKDDTTGKHIVDPLADYDRGRRRLWNQPPAPDIKCLGWDLGDAVGDRSDSVEMVNLTRAAHEALLADKARLDYLDQCTRRLNEATGGSYGWQMIQSHNVNRLLLNWPGDNSVDLQDAQAFGVHPSGHVSVRSAIDKATGYRTGGPGDMDPIICARLREWWKDWELDGDVVRCRSCNRGIIYSKRREQLIHADGCKTYMAYPWALLTALRDPSAEVGA